MERKPVPETPSDALDDNLYHLRKGLAAKRPGVSVVPNLSVEQVNL